MTNTVESLLDDLGFKPDPGFSGYPALYNESGTGVLVVAQEGTDMHLQLYRTDNPGDDFELLRDEAISLRAEWGEYGPVHAMRRIGDLAGVLRSIHLV